VVPEGCDLMKDRISLWIAFITFHFAKKTQ